MHGRLSWYTGLMLLTTLAIVSCSTQAPAPGATGSGVSMMAEPTMMREQDVSIEASSLPGDASMVRVTVVNNETGERTEFPPLPEMQLGRGGIFKYANGALFALHTSGTNRGDLSKEGWKDYLWRYGESGSGTKLLEGRGISFAVSTDARYIVASTVDEVLVLRDGKTVVSKPKSAFALTGGNTNFFLMPVSVGPRASWLSFSTPEQPSPRSIIRIDNTSGALERFDVAQLDLRGPFHVEPERGRLAYWDRPFPFSEEQLAQLDAAPSRLWVFNLKTKKHEPILDLAAGQRIVTLFWEDERNFYHRLEGAEAGVSRPIE